MVECEFGQWECGINALTVLIDTWWNVNSAERAHFNVISKVLIDTWWNVNSELVSQLEYIHEVLIDTWWNVNILVRRLRPGGETGFNRYMVECE